jgi:hypothetical protein
MAKQICETLRNQGHTADVRLTLRCGVPEGLRTLVDREVNLCTE